jgi:hypothetical protein
MSELSTGSKRAFDQITGGDTDSTPTEPGAEDAGWLDEELQSPIDTELQLSSEGGETEHLAEYLGK